MLQYDGTVARSVATNSVLRNTYMLLSLTLIFAAVTAYIGTTVQFSMWGYIGTIVLSFVALFAIHAVKNSGWAVALVFAFTGLSGFSMGPLLQQFLNMPNGSLLIATAAGITALIFGSLSAYVLVTRKDYSFMGGMLFMGLIALVLVSLVAMFFSFPMLHLALAYVSIILFSGFVLYDTSRIVNGGETNYVLATVQLYLNIQNIFVSVLRIIKE